jgi:deazaflavin-dependent oxidoreductase (nitroreductase family)
MPNIRWLLALITVLHRALYRATGGRIGANMAGMRMLLLETLGRRSGQRRATPLLYVEDGERFVVVASNAGDARNPAWLLNLRKHPEAGIQVGTRRVAVRAREASASPPTRPTRTTAAARSGRSRSCCSSRWRSPPQKCDPGHQIGHLLRRLAWEWTFSPPSRLRAPGGAPTLRPP